MPLTVWPPSRCPLAPKPHPDPTHTPAHTPTLSLTLALPPTTDPNPSSIPGPDPGQVLLAHKANLHFAEPFGGNTPLHAFAAEGFAEVPPAGCTRTRTRTAHAHATRYGHGHGHRQGMGMGMGMGMHMKTRMPMCCRRSSGCCRRARRPPPSTSRTARLNRRQCMHWSISTHRRARAARDETGSSSPLRCSPVCEHDHAHTLCRPQHMPS